MISILLLCIALTGIGLWLRGQKKGSRMTVFIGCLGAAASLLYFAGGGLLLPLAPLVALGASYWTVASADEERDQDKRNN